ncbi:uncharacterized protein LOC116003958 [Ipomoea triloba]|uniref:uncharacterized protein LOC116003958 n=1 Tax=Ipomoea triloba TaxID=35885 RepID=UPI00125E6242|nr:uncharacterized protein LOC116003958 [Ipomoea triloba]
MSLNDVYITLVPKRVTLVTVRDLRAVALCNVLYNILSKMLVNRLKVVLHQVISVSQSAFLPSRLITDNVLVASKVIHFLNPKRKGRDGWCALKLDMAKAYDKMEWSFLETIMHRMGFHHRWISMIMLCVTTVRYKVGVNGELSDLIVSSCGIRQEAGAIKSCLVDYERMSGQTVIYNKSCIVFSQNTANTVRTVVAEVFNVNQSANIGRYLGLPMGIGRNKREVFSYIESKLIGRLSGWNKKIISRAGKEVLLKSVAQALPTYSMKIYYFLVTLCERIKRVMNKFWWGTSGGGSNGIGWMAWNRMCSQKWKGGIGFKVLSRFNVALLAKQGWRLMTNPTSLADSYKARYYPRDDFLDAKIGVNPSYCWRSILASQEVLRRGSYRRIGNGQDTCVWRYQPETLDHLTKDCATVVPLWQTILTSTISGIGDDCIAWMFDTLSRGMSCLSYEL